MINHYGSKSASNYIEQSTLNTASSPMGKIAFLRYRRPTLSTRIVIFSDHIELLTPRIKIALNLDAYILLKDIESTCRSKNIKLVYGYC